MSGEPIFEEYERRVLEKYRRGGKVEDADMGVLERLSLIGLVKWGFNYRKMYPIAKVSELGARLLE